MINEFSASGNFRFGYTHGKKFLHEFLEESAKKSNWIDIATFSLNLSHLSDGSIGKKLIDLRTEEAAAGKDINVRIVCGEAKNLQQVHEEIPMEGLEATLSFIGEYTLHAKVYQLKHGTYDLNHCKMILSEELAYIGSLNFGPSASYESGVIIENNQTIKKIRANIFEDLIKKAGIPLA